jgi:hypothetical protein
MAVVHSPNITKIKNKNLTDYNTIERENKTAAKEMEKSQTLHTHQT